MQLEQLSVVLRCIYCALAQGVVGMLKIEHQGPNSQSFSLVSAFCHWPVALANYMSSIGIG